MCPQYARFDHTLDPAPVTGWYDTDAFTYAILPDFRDMLQVTANQWAARLNNPTDWAVTGGDTLIIYVAPLPLPQQAQNMLAGKLAQGLAVTSDSLPAINATYALDNVSTAQVFQIGTFANSFGVFPSGDTTLAYPDTTGMPHTFSLTVFIAFLRAVAALVSSLQTQAGIMANGGSPNWPAQTADIT